MTASLMRPTKAEGLCTATTAPYVSYFQLSMCGCALARLLHSLAVRKGFQYAVLPQSLVFAACKDNFLPRGRLFHGFVDTDASFFQYERGF